MSSVRAPRSILPGFGLSLGFTLTYLSLIVLIPLAAAFIKTAGMSWADFVSAVASPRLARARVWPGPPPEISSARMSAASGPRTRERSSM